VTCDLSILTAETTAAQLALGLAQVSSTGTAYKADIATYWVPH
jgi:hypothetical protein